MYSSNAPFVVPPLGGFPPGFRLKAALRTSATIPARSVIPPAVGGTTGKDHADGQF